jgi:flagellar assembly factor FliW
MLLKTKAFGEIEVSELQRITFEKGLFGFEDINTYFLLDSEKDSPFFWLQAENVPEIAFVLIDPLFAKNDYVLDVDPKDVEELGINDDKDTLVFSIVTIYDKPEDITVNLLGPILINKKTRKALQIINQRDYSVKHPLFEKKEP